MWNYGWAIPPADEAIAGASTNIFHLFHPEIAEMKTKKICFYQIRLLED